MPRTIQDDYELPNPDDDDDLYEVPLGGRIRRRSQPRPIGLFLLIPLAIAAAVYFGYNGYHDIVARQSDDQNCLLCHTDQHDAYLARANGAIAGDVAADLASFHYQQIVGKGGAIRCIDCHRGDDSTRARVETVALSARISMVWLLSREITGTDATAQLRDDPTGGSNALMRGSNAVIAPHLSNDGCVTCHRDTVLTAGVENHRHNALPVAYDLWKNGARLIPPAGDADAQAVIARGLIRYETRVTCSDCHQTHRSTAEANYLSTAQVNAMCVQCHTDSGVRAER
jgi:predicted CXXCH cytochrome family protein